jgi:serine/threonine protein phosphatase 1
VTATSQGASHIGTVEHAGPVAVIGDIHGRVDLLDALLRELPREAAIVVVGDLCDRGPSTREVIARLIDRGATGARGNHDEWFTVWAQGRGFDRAALGFGGEATLTSYGSVGKGQREIDAEGALVPREHLTFLESLTHAVDLRVGDERYWVIHAGIPSTTSFAGLTVDGVVPWLVKNRPADLLWAFNDAETMSPVDRPVIMGHVPRARPIDTGDSIAIDTGAGTRRYGKLTAVVLPERRFVSVW